MTNPPFLEVPLEIRIQIYRLLLHNGKPICMEPGSRYQTSKTCKLDPGYGSKGSIYSSPPEEEFRTYTVPSSYSDRLQGAQLGILSVNRQASEVFYSENCFRFIQPPFGGNSSMIPFLEARSPESRKLIRTIEFEYALYASFDRYKSWYCDVCEPLFKETCIHLARHLKLQNLTLYVWTADFHNCGSQAGRELVERK